MVCGCSRSDWWSASGGGASMSVGRRRRNHRRPSIRSLDFDDRVRSAPGAYGSRNEMRLTAATKRIEPGCALARRRRRARRQLFGCPRHVIVAIGTTVAPQRAGGEPGQLRVLGVVDEALEEHERRVGGVPEAVVGGVVAPLGVGERDACPGTGAPCGLAALRAQPRLAHHRNAQVRGQHEQRNRGGDGDGELDRPGVVLDGGGQGRQVELHGGVVAGEDVRVDLLLARVGAHGGLGLLGLADHRQPAVSGEVDLDEAGSVLGSDLEHRTAAVASVEAVPDATRDPEPPSRHRLHGDELERRRLHGVAEDLLHARRRDAVRCSRTCGHDVVEDVGPDEVELVPGVVELGVGLIDQGLHRRRRVRDLGHRLQLGSELEPVAEQAQVLLRRHLRGGDHVCLARPHLATGDADVVGGGVIGQRRTGRLDGGRQRQTRQHRAAEAEDAEASPDAEPRSELVLDDARVVDVVELVGGHGRQPPIGAVVDRQRAHPPRAADDQFGVATGDVGADLEQDAVLDLGERDGLGLLGLLGRVDLGVGEQEAGL